MHCLTNISRGKLQLKARVFNCIAIHVSSSATIVMYTQLKILSSQMCVTSMHYIQCVVFISCVQTLPQTVRFQLAYRNQSKSSSITHNTRLLVLKSHITPALCQLELLFPLLWALMTCATTCQCIWPYFFDIQCSVRCHELICGLPLKHRLLLLGFSITLSMAVHVQIDICR